MAIIIDGTNGITYSDSTVQNTKGFAYTSQYAYTGNTTNATETELFNSVSNTRLSVANNTTLFYNIDVMARRTDVVGDYAAFTLKGVVDNSANTVTDIGDIFQVIIVRTNTNYDCDARADNTNKTINIYVTGASAQTINWNAVITTIQV
jgi:hypothetical protein